MDDSYWPMTSNKVVKVPAAGRGRFPTPSVSHAKMQTGRCRNRLYVYCWDLIRMKFKMILFVLTISLANFPCVSADESLQSSDGHCDSVERLVSRAYIQAKPGQLGRLKQFIRVNFFAIDAKAVQQGIMHSYALLERVESSDNRMWDLMLIDTWCDDQGLDAVADSFEEITRAHQKVLIDGLDFDDLGTFVGSDSVIEKDRPSS